MLLVLLLLLLGVATASNNDDTLAFGSPEAPLHVAVVCGLAEFDDMAEMVCRRWAETLKRREPTTRLTLIVPPRPRPHSLVSEWPPLVGLCSDASHTLVQRSAAALDTEQAVLDAKPDIVIVLRIGMNAVVVPFETCDAMPLNAPELWLVANAIAKQVDRSDNIGLPAVVEAPAFRVIRGSGSVGRPVRNGGSLPDYLYHAVGVPVVLSLYVYENPYALQEDLGASGDLTVGQDLFFSGRPESVAAALDGVLDMLAYPNEELYVSLCVVTGVLHPDAKE